MGNQAMNCPAAPTGDTQLNAYLTPRQIHLVQDTWDIIKDDLSKLGVIVFLR